MGWNRSGQNELVSVVQHVIGRVLGLVEYHHRLVAFSVGSLKGPDLQKRPPGCHAHGSPGQVVGNNLPGGLGIQPERRRAVAVPEGDLGSPPRSVGTPIVCQFLQNEAAVAVPARLDKSHVLTLGVRNQVEGPDPLVAVAIGAAVRERDSLKALVVVVRHTGPRRIPEPVVTANDDAAVLVLPVELLAGGSLTGPGGELDAIPGQVVYASSGHVFSGQSKGAVSVPGAVDQSHHGPGSRSHIPRNVSHVEIHRLDG
mmetsp:Transcript_8210/g.24270  ORF Transcript_8210/g.24270 Transcript_8210/m.24270 type:complete len:256 (-) Transcript_8210:1940-2707(-)